MQEHDRDQEAQRNREDIHEYFYGDDHDCDPEARYEVLSTTVGEPDDITCWCETAALETASTVFELLEANRRRLRLESLGIFDRTIGRSIRSLAPG